MMFRYFDAPLFALAIFLAANCSPAMVGGSLPIGHNGWPAPFVEWEYFGYEVTWQNSHGWQWSLQSIWLDLLFGAAHVGLSWFCSRSLGPEPLRRYEPRTVAFVAVCIGWSLLGIVPEVLQSRYGLSHRPLASSIWLLTGLGALATWALSGGRQSRGGFFTLSLGGLLWANTLLATVGGWNYLAVTNSVGHDAYARFPAYIDGFYAGAASLALLRAVVQLLQRDFVSAVTLLLGSLGFALFAAEASSMGLRQVEYEWHLGMPLLEIRVVPIWTAGVQPLRMLLERAERADQRQASPRACVAILGHSGCGWPDAGHLLLSLASPHLQTAAGNAAGQRVRRLGAGASGGECRLALPLLSLPSVALW